MSFIESTAYKGVLGLISAGTLGLLTVVVAQQFFLSGSVGEHTAKIDSIAASIAKLDTDLNARLDNIDADLTELNTDLKIVKQAQFQNQIDVPSLLTRLGIVNEGDVFTASFVGDEIWLFTVQTDLADRLEASGRSQKMFGDTIAGYPVLPTSAVMNYMPRPMKAQ